MDKKITIAAQEFLQETLIMLGFQDAKVDLTVEETEEKDNISIKVSGEGLELLIGYHGNNLQALHHILVTYLKQQLGRENPKKFSLFLDIGNYFEKENDKIREMAIQAVEEVKLLDEPYEFQPMSPRLRRVIHLELEKHSGIRTESKGEGIDRRVVIYPANAPKTSKD